MDYEADFTAAVTSTIETLLARGKSPRTFAFNGREIVGWSIDTQSHDSMKGSPGTSFWEEYWDRSDTVMATDGTFWRCGFWASEGSNGKEREEFCRSEPLSHFVGNSGPPFSAWKAKLERLPYL